MSLFVAGRLSCLNRLGVLRALRFRDKRRDDGPMMAAPLARELCGHTPSSPYHTA